MSTQAAARLTSAQYLLHLRDSLPQTRYLLAQWQCLYDEYDCEMCAESRARIFGSDDVDVRLVDDLSKSLKTGRYTACVNLRYDNTLVHACNFVPLIVGTKLDLQVRGCGGIRHDLSHALLFDENLCTRLGHAFMFKNFWVFSAFISTDARQCHRYRERTKNAECSVRMYVYDQYGKGHMLFLKPHDPALYLRDKFRREVCVVNASGGDAIDSATCEVVESFAEAVLVAPFDALSTTDFFRYCREYMLNGVSESDANGRAPVAAHIRDIDHLDNKRISVAPALYASLLRALFRNVEHVIEQYSDDDFVTSAIRGIIVRYGTMSHRANLLPFISRKTHIRHDWCETMKRQMKSEIRAKRRHRAPATSLTASCLVVAANNDGNVRTFRVHTPNITQDNTKVSQQFYCSKLHSDVEYDHELVKRMRVVNLNAMNCLRLPSGFERFLSYCNVGNIGNAGRVMTKTHSMRESYIPAIDAVLSDTVAWIREYFASRVVVAAAVTDDDFALIAVNEIPILRIGGTFRELENSSTDSLWQFMLAIKYGQPGCSVTVTRLRERSHYVNVRIAHSVPLCPVNIIVAPADAVRPDNYAVWCTDCREYQSPACLSVHLDASVVEGAWQRRRRHAVLSPLPVCRSHCWFTRHELGVYFLNRKEPRPLMHEIACHGLLSVARYPLCTDMSKIIVSINAHRRSLNVVDDVKARVKTGGLLAAWAKYGVSSDSNGKFTRLLAPARLLRTDDQPFVPKNAVRLMFAFGDVDMLNCEDGYVLNDTLPLLAETLFRKKIVISCKSGTPIGLVARMRLHFERDHGARLHVGTVLSAARITVPCGNDVLVYQRIPVRCDGGNLMYACDIYLAWTASFVQSPVGGEYEPTERIVLESSADDDRSAPLERLLHEEFRYDDCPVISLASVEVFQRALRVSVCSRPARQTLKLQNSFGQKGVAHLADLSDLVTDRGEPVDVISSMYSLVGRSACGQLLEQRYSGGPRTVFSKTTGRQVARTTSVGSRVR